MSNEILYECVKARRQSLLMAFDIVANGPTFICDQNPSLEAIVATRDICLPMGTPIIPDAKPVERLEDVKVICWPQWQCGRDATQVWLSVSQCLWTSKCLRETTPPLVERTGHISDLTDSYAAKWLVLQFLSWHLRLTNSLEGWIMNFKMQK